MANVTDLINLSFIYNKPPVITTMVEGCEVPMTYIMNLCDDVQFRILLCIFVLLLANISYYIMSLKVKSIVKMNSIIRYNELIALNIGLLLLILVFNYI